MQSIRQNRKIKNQIIEEFENGRIASAAAASVHSYRASSIPARSFGSEKESRRSNRCCVIQIIGWDGADDPLDPRNWSLSYRCWIFFILWINVFAVAWGSPLDIEGRNNVEMVFDTSGEEEALSWWLYTLGLSVGSLLAGPISEAVGRNPVYVLSRFLHVVWLLGAALAPNLEALSVFRLFAGINGSAMLTVYAASTADIFGPKQRKSAWPLIALAPFLGISFSPLVRAWVEHSSLSERWTDWISLIISGSTFVFLLLGLPETFSPIILKWKAAHLRLATCNASFLAELDLQETIFCRLNTALLRSWRMATRERGLTLLAAWLALVSLIVSVFWPAFLSYFKQDDFEFSNGVANAVFPAAALGCSLWTFLGPLYFRGCRKAHRSIREIFATNPDYEQPNPEHRFRSVLVAVVALSVSFFWLAWSECNSLAHWCGLGSLVLAAYAWTGIYTTTYQYIVDVYGIYSGSALAIITSWSYFASGLGSLLGVTLDEVSEVRWAFTMLGGSSLILTLGPLVIWMDGSRLRAISPFAGTYSRPDACVERIGRAAGWAHYCA